MGRNASVSYEEAVTIIETLLLNGEKITVANVQARLEATPSSTTISNYIKQWREACAEQNKTTWPSSLPESLFSPLQTVWQEALTQARESMRSMEEANNRKAQELEAREVEQRQEVASLRGDISVLDTRIDSLTGAIADRDKQLVTASEALESERLRVSDLLEDVQTLSNDLAVEQEKATAHEKLTTKLLDDHLKEITRLTEQFDDQKRMLNARSEAEESRLMMTISEQRDLIKSLQKQLSDESTRAVKAEKQAAMTDRELDLLRQTYNRSKSDFEESKSELQSSLSQLRAERDALSERYLTSEKAITELNAQVVSLNTQLQSRDSEQILNSKLDDIVEALRKNVQTEDVSSK